MWLITEYRPVTLFSFRSGMATTSGAKSLFLPTPFAIRMALLDGTIRTQGLAVGERAFDWIRRLSIATRPPERVVVTNLFAKILKPTRREGEEVSAMDRTIAFREYVQLEGNLSLAFAVSESHNTSLQALLPQVNYFGKRGSFFQMTGHPRQVSELPEGFVLLDGIYVHNNQVMGQGPMTFTCGIIQMMDDWGENLTFAKANIYSEEKIVMGKDRIRKSIILPYRRVCSSRSFTYYERIG